AEARFVPIRQQVKIDASGIPVQGTERDIHGPCGRGFDSLLLIGESMQTYEEKMKGFDIKLLKNKITYEEHQEQELALARDLVFVPNKDLSQWRKGRRAGNAIAKHLGHIEENPIRSPEEVLAGLEDPTPGTFLKALHEEGYYLTDEDLPEVEMFLGARAGENKFAQERVPEEDLKAEIVFGTSGWRDGSSKMTVENTSRVAQAIAEVIPGDIGKSLSDIQAAIGYDARPGGRERAIRVVEVLTANGIHADLIDQVNPTPIMAESTRVDLPEGERYDFAVQITASHNPVYASPDQSEFWLGMKLLRDGVPAGDELTGKIAGRANDKNKKATYKRIPFENIPEALATHGVDLIARSNDRLRKVFNFDELRQKLEAFKERYPEFGIRVDAMHGGTVQAVRILEEFGIPVDFNNMTPLYEEVEKGTLDKLSKDATWGPNPTIPSFLGLNGETKGKEEIDFYLDGDGDRLVNRDIDGTILTPNQLGLVFAHYLYHHKGERGRVVRTLPTSRSLDRFAERVGAELIETPVGSKHFAPYTVDGSILVGVEESGHVFFKINGEIFADSAIAEAVLILEIMATTGMSLREYLDKIEEEQGMLVYSRLDLVLEIEVMAALSKLRDERPEVFARSAAEKLGKNLILDEGGQLVDGLGFDTTDKSGILLRFDDGTWAMYRLSGTEPIIRIYGEETSKERLEIQQQTVKDLLIELTSEQVLEVNPIFASLAAQGHVVSKDFITPEMITSGEFERQVRAKVVYSATTNPSSNDKVWGIMVNQTKEWVPLIEAMVKDGKTDQEIYDTLFIEHLVVPAMKILGPVNRETNYMHGYVSYEFRPEFTKDPDMTQEKNHDKFNTQVREALTELARLDELITEQSGGLHNFFIKVPATPVGIEAGRLAINAGININFTLIATLDQYIACVNAYKDGVRRYIEDGEMRGKVSESPYAKSVASDFVSRTDRTIDQLLPDEGDDAALKMQAGLAYAIGVIYKEFMREFLPTEDTAWDKFSREHNVPIQQIYWGSTGVKDKDGKYTSDPHYAGPLRLWGTTNTAPPDVVDAMEEKAPFDGNIEEPDFAKHERVLQRLEELDIDIGEVQEGEYRKGLDGFAGDDKKTFDAIGEFIERFRDAPASREKLVWFFDEKSAPGEREPTKSDLGGKGWGLRDMTFEELPVSPGFTITTQVCNAYLAGRLTDEDLTGLLKESIKRLEEKTGKKFGDPENPLLVSVRSGAAVSMPGMMDTILNEGLNDEI
ncbi:transaldolase family protein, partial [Candidatus Omnitrophota bacterium]